MGECKHDWEIIEAKTISDMRGWYENYFYQYKSRLDEFFYNMTEIDFVGRIDKVLAQKVCLICGECVDEIGDLTNKLDAEILKWKERRWLAERIWESCHGE